MTTEYIAQKPDHLVMVRLDMCSLDGLRAYDASEANIPFQCQECSGHGHAFDESNEIESFYGCERCDGAGWLPASELSVKDFVRVSQ
jgi:DnaJ-class molecular chaperone